MACWYAHVPSQDPEVKTFYLIRHGTSELTKIKKENQGKWFWQRKGNSTPDVELESEGENEASELGGHIDTYPFFNQCRDDNAQRSVAFVTSNLRRAINTMMIAFKDLFYQMEEGSKEFKVHVMSNFQEICAGKDASASVRPKNVKPQP